MKTLLPPGISSRLSRLVLVLLFFLTGFQESPVETAAYQEDICALPFQTVSLPLTELGDQPYTRMDGQVTEYTGGLYPGGSNTRPTALEAAGRAAAEQIQPRNAQGEPDPARGKIGLISIGMSNTSFEFGAFSYLVEADSEINPRLALVNGALSNQTADRWIDPSSIAWQHLDQLLPLYEVNPLQVQAAWVKLTLTRGGEFPDKALQLQDNLETIARNLKARFPNLQIAYFSSRTRSYTYFRGLSPEPLAFETGFAVKWMIEKQIQGDPGLNYDPAKGEVLAPLLLWGPYLWTDGQNPRADGLVWLQEDMTFDCTHPSQNGQQKVAEMLLEFFKTDTTTQWFLAQQPAQPAPTTQLPIATPSPAPTFLPTLAPTATHQAIHTPTLVSRQAPAATATTISLQETVPEKSSPSPILYLVILFSSITLAGGWLWMKRRK